MTEEVRELEEWRERGVQSEGKDSGKDGDKTEKPKEGQNTKEKV